MSIIQVFLNIFGIKKEEITEQKAAMTNLQAIN